MEQGTPAWWREMKLQAYRLVAEQQAADKKRVAEFVGPPRYLVSKSPFKARA